MAENIQLYYGSYVHPISPSVTIQKNVLRDDFGREIGHKEIWDISGEIIRHQGETTAELQAKIDQLIAAYSRDNLPIKIVGNNTYHQITPAEARQIIVTTPPEFPQGGGAELITIRRYHIVVSAEIIDNAPEIISFSESISITPAWQDFVMRVRLIGTPVRQDTVIRPAMLVQQGSAVGRTTWPDPPDPIWGDANLHPPEIVRHAPEMSAKGILYNYKIDWTYRYEFADTPIDVSPHTLLEYNGH